MNGALPVNANAASLELDDRHIPHFHTLDYTQRSQHAMAYAALPNDTDGPLNLRYGSLHCQDHRAEVA